MAFSFPMLCILISFIISVLLFCFCSMPLDIKAVESPCFLGIIRSPLAHPASLTKPALENVGVDGERWA
jgi:hypothetical protein